MNGYSTHDGNKRKRSKPGYNEEVAIQRNKKTNVNCISEQKIIRKKRVSLRHGQIIQEKVSLSQN